MRRISLFVTVAAALAATTLAAAPAHAGKPGATTCTALTPQISIENSYGWSQWGTWARAGDRVPFDVMVMNSDNGRCGSATFTVNVSVAPSLTSDVASFALSLAPGQIAHRTVYVTSPAGTPDGDYPVSATVVRPGSASASFASAYKVYSTDTAAPTLYWASPGSGSTVSGTTQLGIYASDEHMARSVSIYIDGAFVSTTTNVGTSYEMQAYYSWSTRKASAGVHTVRYVAVDDLGNTASQTETYTVG